MKRMNKVLVILFFAGLTGTVSGQGVKFDPDFAPSEPLVKPQERPYRDDLCLNGLWNFFPVENAEKLTRDEILNPAVPDHPSWENVRIKIPSPWNVNSFARGDGGDFITYPGYPEKWEKIRAGWLMRTLPYREAWKNKRLVLHFEAITGYAQVYVNKKKVGENVDLFLPFELDITDVVNETGDNELLVWVADAELFNQPGKYGHRTHVGGSFWGQHAIGIWQDVWLLAKPAVHIQNLFIKPFPDRDELEVELTVSNQSSKSQVLDVSGGVMPWINLSGNMMLEAPEPRWKLGEEVLSLPEGRVQIAPNTTKTIQLKTKVSGRLNFWSPEQPDLYGLIVSLSGKKHVMDKLYDRFGWRQFSLIGNKFYLNGKEILLKGDSWHFMGIPQMTRRYAWAWYTMLKDCHANAVRLHAQPYPAFYLDMADEMGIFVLDETGIWASDGGPKADAEDYWKNCEDHVKRLILRDRNHPSVFGWSVCNENLPVVINVQRAPDSLISRQVSEINKWYDLAKKLDPTRTWISGDGETNRPTNLPVIIGHYGKEPEYRQWSSQGKLWGIGEAGMAYAGTPREAAAFNGNRAYESQQGRMEGVALEAMELLNLQKKYKASFSSIFNVVWYGLKPLELGLKDTSRAPELSDGIFFKPYQEGKPGVQPERLGPYTTTLNPGYDPALPLYDPWPLYDMVKASFADTGIVDMTGKLKQEPVRSVSEPLTPAAGVILLSAGQNSVLYRILDELGIETVSAEKALPGKHYVMIVDGKNPPPDNKILSLEKATFQNGGVILIWGIQPQSLSIVNRYLPSPAAITARKATSFVKKGDDPLLSGLENSDFYFTEIAEKPVMEYGLSGDFVKDGRILLEACPADWSRWNHKPEYYKTAAVIRSEREAKAEGNALVLRESDSGKIYFLTLDPAILSGTAVSLLRQIFSNAGVSAQNKNNVNIQAINPEGVLESALVIGSFEASDKSFSEISRMDFLKEPDEKSYFAGRRMNGRFWEAGKAREGVFDFRKMNMTGPQENAVAYLSFWLYSPRSLTDLLVAPDMPQLNMFIGADDGFQFFLNRKLIRESLKEGGLTKREHFIKALPLEKGWNHFLIKVIQKGGDWKLAVEFECDHEDFLKEIKSKINP